VKACYVPSWFWPRALRCDAAAANHVPDSWWDAAHEQALGLRQPAESIGLFGTCLDTAAGSILQKVRGQAPWSDIPLDRLEVAQASVQVVLLADQSYPEDGDCGFRRPHRHDYHELIWVRRGVGSHLIDGQRSLVEPRQVTVIGRGQVHVFERAAHLDGALVRFGDEMLQVGAQARANPSWVLGFQGPQAVPVRDSDVARLDGLIESLSDEASRSPDSRSVDVQGHLLCTLLLWVERWHASEQAEQRDGDDGALQLYRRFVDLLERHYARRHEASEYADELGVPQAVLSRAAAEITGRRTKELITDRRMLEAARLLRFTDSTIREAASRAGFNDQLYFSRAFKRYYGDAPTEYRDRVRGR
jgi:AraC family transcriptional activator of pobA